MSSYRLRGNNVLLRVSHRKKVGSVLVPEVSREGRQLHVVDFAPGVGGLKKGDLVMLQGAAGAMVYEVPGAPDLIVVEEKYIVLVIEE